MWFSAFFLGVHHCSLTSINLLMMSQTSATVALPKSIDGIRTESPGIPHGGALDGSIAVEVQGDAGEMEWNAVQ